MSPRDSVSRTAQQPRGASLSACEAVGGDAAISTAATAANAAARNAIVLTRFIPPSFLGRPSPARVSCRELARRELARANTATDEKKRFGGRHPRGELGAAARLISWTAESDIVLAWSTAEQEIELALKVTVLLVADRSQPMAARSGPRRADQGGPGGRPPAQGRRSGP